MLDTRLKPTLRLLSFDDQGRPAEAMNFTVLVSRWEQGSPRMVLKYLVPKGWLVLWAKERPGTAAAPGRQRLHRPLTRTRNHHPPRRPQPRRQRHLFPRRFLAQRGRRSPQIRRFNV